MRTRNTCKLPFVRSYWVVPGALLGGFYPGDRDPAVTKGKLTALLASGVTHFVNLMPVHERDHAGRPFLAYETGLRRIASTLDVAIHRLRKPITDLSVPSMAQMIEILDAIDGAVFTGGCVYVHCWGGKGRTGTVMGCWLARHGERHPLQRLREFTAHAPEFFPRVPETTEQQDFVRSWEEGR